MWTVSAFQQHPRTLMICDENATLELKVPQKISCIRIPQTRVFLQTSQVKTVKYFKDLWEVHQNLNKEDEAASVVYSELKKTGR